MATEEKIRSRGNSPLPPVMSSPSHSKWRDWSNLADGPAGLIAERLFADDVADYIRFRAVCCPWRQLSTDPREHDILDRRFHPRRWIMLRETVAAPDHRRLLLNVSTGQCIRTPLPELSGHCVFGPTTEGLLVLLQRSWYVVRLLNPLKGHVADLPSATTMLRLIRYKISSTDDDFDLIEEYDFTEEFKVSAAGLADESTIAVYFSEHNMLVVAKLGDKCWTLVDDQMGLISQAMSFEGRFYCPTDQGLKVVEINANQPPHLVLVAELTKVFSRIPSTIHLVDNGGEMLLVYRNIQRQRLTTMRCNLITTIIEESVEYKAYRVDLKAMDTKPMLGLGGRAIFIGFRCAVSLSPLVFPSIKSDSIYVGRDELMLGKSPEFNGVYCLIDGTSEPCGILKHGPFDEESGSIIGPWGINDYLSRYVTEKEDD